MMTGYDTMQKKIIELERLTQRWLKRREKLRKQASDLKKADTPANKNHSDQFLGRFNEIDKCRRELVAILNRMKKDL
jgi:hypothetical protein